MSASVGNASADFSADLLMTNFENPSCIYTEGKRTDESPSSPWQVECVSAKQTICQVNNNLSAQLNLKLSTEMSAHMQFVSSAALPSRSDPLGTL